MSEVGTDAVSLTRRILFAADALDACQRELEDRIREAAEAERFYRWCKSQATVKVVGRGETVAERAALAEQETFQLEGEWIDLGTVRYRRDLSKGLESAAMEAVRNGRQVLSSLQTVGNLARTEAEFIRTGPEIRP